MARKKEDTGQSCSVVLKPHIIEQVDRLAEKTDKTRSKMLSDMVEAALEDILLLEKIGLVDMFLFGRRFIEQRKEVRKKLSELDRGKIKA